MEEQHVLSRWKSGPELWAGHSWWRDEMSNTLASTSLGSLKRNHHVDIKQNWIRVRWIFLTHTNLKRIQYIIYFHNELITATTSQKSGVEWISSRIIIIQRRILGLKRGSGDNSGLINNCWQHQCSGTLSRPIPGHAWNKNHRNWFLWFYCLGSFQNIQKRLTKLCQGVLADSASVTVVTSLQVAHAIKFPWPLGSNTKTSFTLTTHL